MFFQRKNSEKSIEKLVKVFKVFKLIMEINDVECFRACATSAMREANNNIAIINTIKKKTGIDLK